MLTQGAAMFLLIKSPNSSGRSWKPSWKSRSVAKRTRPKACGWEGGFGKCCGQIRTHHPEIMRMWGWVKLYIYICIIYIYIYPMDPNTVWEGTYLSLKPPNYSKLYPLNTSFQKVRLDQLGEVLWGKPSAIARSSRWDRVWGWVKLA